MPARDSDVVVLVSGKHRAVISSVAARKRKTDGLGEFDGHTKIHRVELGNSESKPEAGDVLALYGIPNELGKCSRCEGGKCKSARVGVMRSTFVSHGVAEPWTRMRVRGDRKRRNKAEIPLIAKFGLRNIEGEIREIQAVPNLDPPFFDEFNHVDQLIRMLELEENQAFVNGGRDSLSNLRQERKTLFIRMLEVLVASGRHRLVAEEISRIRQFVFPTREKNDELTRFDWLLRECDETAAERRTATLAARQARALRQARNRR